MCLDIEKPHIFYGALIVLYDNTPAILSNYNEGLLDGFRSEITGHPAPIIMAAKWYMDGTKGMALSFDINSKASTTIGSATSQFSPMMAPLTRHIQSSANIAPRCNTNGRINKLDHVASRP